MTRSLVILIVLASVSSTFAQRPQDPVENLTTRVLRNFFGSWDDTSVAPVPAPAASRWSASTDELTEREESGSREAASGASRWTPNRVFSNSTMPSIDEWGPAAKQPRRQGRPARHFDMNPFVGRNDTSMLPNFGFGSSQSQSGFLSAPQSASRAGYSTAWTTSRTPVAPDVPQPMAFSRAFANGLHSIEAIVPTDHGPERVKLEGNDREVQDQLDSLPQDVRRIMTRSLRAGF